MPAFRSQTKKPLQVSYVLTRMGFRHFHPSRSAGLLASPLPARLPIRLTRTVAFQPLVSPTALYWKVKTSSFMGSQHRPLCDGFPPSSLFIRIGHTQNAKSNFPGFTGSSVMARPAYGHRSCCFAGPPSCFYTGSLSVGLKPDRVSAQEDLQRVHPNHRRRVRDCQQRILRAEVILEYTGRL